MVAVLFQGEQTGCERELGENPKEQQYRRDKKQEECSQETEEVPERQEVDWDRQSQSVMGTTGRDAFRKEGVVRGPKGAESQPR